MPRGGGHKGVVFSAVAREHMSAARRGKHHAHKGAHVHHVSHGGPVHHVPHHRRGGNHGNHRPKGHAAGSIRAEDGSWVNPHFYG